MIIQTTWVGCHIFQAPARHVVSERRNDPAEIIVVQRGVYQVQYRQDEQEMRFAVRNGDVVFWPARAWRLEIGDEKQPLHCIAIYLRGTWPDTLPRHLKDRGGLIRMIAHRMIDLKGESLADSLQQELFACYCNAIIAEYVRLAGLEQDTFALGMSRFIMEHLSEPITLKQLALAVDLNPHHLCRRYRKLTGHTPMDEVRRRKAAHARDMILTLPTRPLKEVCASVGIANPKRLIRLINRYSGERVRDLRHQTKP